METREFADRRFVERRIYNIKQLWDHQQEMVRRSCLGESNGQIGEAMGYTAQQVSNVINSTLAREKAAQLNAAMDERVIDITQRIREFQPVALQYLEDVIQGKVEGASPALTVGTAKHYLAMGGHGPITKIHSISERATREDIEELKQRKREAAMNAGSIAVDYQEVE